MKKFTAPPQIIFVLVVLLVMSNFTGCVFKREISGQEVGIMMSDGVSISEIVSSGRYTDMGYYADLKKIDVSTHTLMWTDSDVWTSDKQVVTFTASISYARKRDPDSIRGIWTTYNFEAQDNEALKLLVLTRIPRAVKSITTTYTLDQMLGIDEGSTKDRETLKNDIFTMLEKLLAEAHIELIDFGVSNIAPDDVYLSKLKEKSTAKIDIELADAQRIKYEKQKATEDAQTEVELTIAARDNAVAQEKAKVFAMSPEAYELERLRLLQGIMGDSSKVYFIPEGADLSIYLAGEGSSAPIINKTETPNE